MKQILLISHIKVHNANALSSPYTIGFPAMTAWLGAVHALQRRLNQAEFDSLFFKSVAVVCHDINLQIFRGKGDFVNSIIGTGNPLVPDGHAKKDKWNSPFIRPAFVEESRCRLDVSLAVEYEGLAKDQEHDARVDIATSLYAGMKMAGGDILNFGCIEFLKIENNVDLGRLTRKLMPGHVLIERRELMETDMAQGQDAVDALLDYLKVMHRSEQDEDGKVLWSSRRRMPGWIVPVATGFHGITELGQAENQRDQETAHRFAESVVTLGEFVMPYRINDLDAMLWHYHVDLENNLYLCQQNNRMTN
jgi:CRISPR-associated protein Csy2